MIREEVLAASQSYEPNATLSLRVAEAIKDELRRNARSVFGLPTGRTPTDVYRLLSTWTKQDELDWSQARCFGLDEYYEVEDSQTFRRYLETNLYKNINLPAHSRFNPLFTHDYDARIAAEGGLDLTILGIGHNGHIAFNEPGTELASWTHSVYLTESTRQANAEFFQGSTIPRRAVTMGIQTILQSRKIILMVSGKKKRSILEAALKGPVTTDVPASFLQLHKNVQVMTDFEY